MMFNVISLTGPAPPVVRQFIKVTATTMAIKATVPPVRIENLIRIDLVTESLNVARQ